MFSGICKALLIVGIMVSSSYSAEESKDVLVIGTNPYLKHDAWHSAKTIDETEWKTHLFQSGFNVQTIDALGDDENIYPDHTKLNLDEIDKLEVFSRDHSQCFDLITNDYCVSYFIHDSSLRCLVKTLKVGGKLVFGPMTIHTSIMVMAEDDLQFLTSDFLNEDISFVRSSAGVYKDCKAVSINPVIREDHQEEIDYKVNLSKELSDAFIDNAIRDAFIETAEKTCEYHTFSNFKKFIEESKIPLEIKIKRSDIEEPKMVAETILPPEHPGKKWGNGDWLVITRTGE